MKKEINLLGEKKTKEILLEDTAKRIKVTSWVILGLYCLAGLGVLIFWMNMSSETNRIEQQIESKKQGITQLKKSEELQLALKERLDYLQTVFGNHTFTYSQIYDDIFALENGGSITLDNLLIDKQGQIKFAGKVDQVLTLSDFLKDIKTRNNKYAQAVLSTLTRDDKGAYLFEVTLALKSAPQTQAVTTTGGQAAQSTTDATSAILK
jgi:hypothetical protein